MELHLAIVSDEKKTLVLLLRGPTAATAMVGSIAFFSAHLPAQPGPSGLAGDCPALCARRTKR